MDKVSIDDFLSEVAVLSKTIQAIDKKLDIYNISSKMSNLIEDSEEDIIEEFRTLYEVNMEYFEEFSKDNEEALKDIKDSIEKSKEQDTSNDITTVTNSVVSSVKSVVSSIINPIKLSIASLSNSFSNFFNPIKDSISSLFSKASNSFTKFFGPIERRIKSAVSSITDHISDIFSSVKKKAKSILGIFSKSFNKLTSLLTKGFSKVGLALSAIKASASKVLEKLPYILMVVAVIAGLIKKAVDWVKDKVTTFLVSIGDLLVAILPDPIANKIIEFLNIPSEKEESKSEPENEVTPNVVITPSEEPAAPEVTTSLQTIPSITTPPLPTLAETSIPSFDVDSTGIDTTQPYGFPVVATDLPTVEASNINNDNSVVNIQNVTVTHYGDKLPYH